MLSHRITIWAHHWQKQATFSKCALRVQVAHKDYIAAGVVALNILYPGVIYKPKNVI